MTEKLSTYMRSCLIRYSILDNVKATMQPSASVSGIVREGESCRSHTDQHSL